MDTILKKHLGLSGTVVCRIKWWPDGILLDGQRVQTDARPQVGQLLSVRLDDLERRSGIVPAPGPLDLVYEDEDLIVVNKAPGVPVHPGPGHYNDTLGNFLLWHYDLEGDSADFHPVHRLDRGTSGLLVAAKHPHAQEILKRQLHTEGFRRTYLAVCEGRPEPPSGLISAPLGAEGRVSGEADGPPRRASRPARAIECCPPTVAAPSSVWSWIPAEPTRFGSTWPISATPYRGLPVWEGRPDADLSPGPSFGGALLPSPPDWPPSVLLPPDARGYGGPAL